MQKPRLTQRTAEALAYASLHLRHDYAHEEIGDKAADLKRAIEYLEDLLRWKRAKENGKC